MNSNLGIHLLNKKTFELLSIKGIDLNGYSSLLEFKDIIFFKDQRVTEYRNIGTIRISQGSGRSINFNKFDFPRKE